eukprot:g6048.t1
MSAAHETRVGRGAVSKQETTRAKNTRDGVLRRGKSQQTAAKNRTSKSAPKTTASSRLRSSRARSGARLVGDTHQGASGCWYKDFEEAEYFKDLSLEDQGLPDAGAGGGGGESGPGDESSDSDDDEAAEAAAAKKEAAARKRAEDNAEATHLSNGTKKREFCSEHAKQGMVDLRHKKCAHQVKDDDAGGGDIIVKAEGGVISSRVTVAGGNLVGDQSGAVSGVRTDEQAEGPHRAVDHAVRHRRTSPGETWRSTSSRRRRKRALEGLDEDVVVLEQGNQAAPAAASPREVVGAQLGASVAVKPEC